MLKTSVELNDNSKISANTALKIEQELTVNKANVKDPDMDSVDKSLKELLAEITDNTNNISVDTDEISKQRKISNEIIR